MLQERNRSLLAVQRQIPISAWLEEHRVVTDGPLVGRQGQTVRWSNDTMPFIREFYRAFDDPQYEILDLIGARQVTKTAAAIINPLLYLAFHVGWPTGLALPSIDQSLQWWRTKIAPVIDASPACRAILPIEGRGAKGGDTEDFRLLNGANIVLLGGETGRSKAKQEGHVVRALVCDEINDFDPDAVARLIERTSSFVTVGRKIIRSGPVETAEDLTWKNYLAGTRGNPAIHCPKCGEIIFLELDPSEAARDLPDIAERMTRFEWSGENAFEAEQSAALICPKCLEPITDEDRIYAIASPVWHYQGQAVEKNAIIGDIKKTRNWSGRFNRLWSPFYSLAAAGAEAFEASKNDTRKKNFQNSVSALPWRAEIKEISLTREHLKRRSLMSWYDFGEVPQGVEYLTGAIDVQKRSLYWLVEGWDFSGRCWTIEFGVQDFVGEEPTDADVTLGLDKVADIMNQGFRRSGGILKPVIIGIDTGGGSFSSASAPGSWAERTRVLEKWLAKRENKFVGVKGLGKGQGDKLSGKAVFSISGLLDVRTQSTGLNLWFIRVDAAKATVQDHFLIENLEANGFHALPRGLAGGPLEYYTRHITAETREVVFDKVLGQVEKWKAHRRANHLLDCSAYSVALAEYWRTIKGDNKPKNVQKTYTMPEYRSSNSTSRMGIRNY